ncbi:preprotein translocase subunit YajC [Eubacterium sp. AB3007]|uniref:preprotein translocase subunit YajC n=1 Tax=Eubacterium sp. AB3007 TaxID=1392487 RepID=UPI001FA72582|nr:preprotein translocase subunit YajC [Eubacterium sp. AB3007]
MASNGAMGLVPQMLILVAFIILMYFMLIRPQKKKEKSINEMRNSLRVGDEVVTIGGICGKIVKTKDDSLILQVGADKVKFEVMRWSISSVTSKSKKSGADIDSSLEEDAEVEVKNRKSGPKRLRKVETEEKAEKKDDSNPFEEEK